MQQRAAVICGSQVIHIRSSHRRCAVIRHAFIVFICFHCLAFQVISRTMWRICSKHTQSVHVCLWSAVTYLVHNKFPPSQSSSFKNPIWFHIGQWNSGGWEASEQSISVMWSMDWAWWVNVCAGSHPSRQSNEICGKGIYPGQAALFIFLLPNSSGVLGTLYSSTLETAFFI